MFDTKENELQIKRNNYVYLVLFSIYHKQINDELKILTGYPTSCGTIKTIIPNMKLYPYKIKTGDAIRLKMK